MAKKPKAKSQKHTKTWHNVEQQDYITYNNFRNFAGWIDEKGYEARIAWQISKPKVETLEKINCQFCNGTGKQLGNNTEWECKYFTGIGIYTPSEVTEQSIEKAGKAYSRKSKMMDGNRVNIWEVDAFIAGATHILTSKGMVELGKVVEIIRNWYFRDKSYDTINTSELTDLLTKIKSIKK